MMQANSRLSALQIAIVAIVFSAVGMQSATAEDAKPVPQFVYKTIGDRELKADILYGASRR